MPPGHAVDASDGAPDGAPDSGSDGGSDGVVDRSGGAVDRLTDRDGDLAVADSGPGAPPASRTRRVIAAAASGRDKAIRQFVALLVPVIRATRYPLLAVVLMPVVPAVLVIAIALARPGPDDWFWLVFAALGLGLGGWLALRRRQLLAVAADPEVLTSALTAMVTGRELWSQLIDNLSAGKVGAAVARRSRPLRMLSGLWRGVRAAGVVAEFASSDELAPLTPLRLRGIWLLVLSCLLAGAVLSVAVLIAALLYLLGA